MKSSNNTNSLSRVNRYLIIFGKPAGIVEPSQRTFNNPPLGQDYPSRFYACGYINSQAQFSENILLKRLAVSCIGTEPLNGWIFLEGVSRCQNTRLCIMYIGSMNHHRQQIPHGIHYDVPFASFCFFPPSIPRFSAAEVVFTLCESMIA